jgi:hypothetical protein
MFVFNCLNVLSDVVLYHPHRTQQLFDVRDVRHDLRFYLLQRHDICIVLALHSHYICTVFSLYTHFTCNEGRRVRTKYYHLK